MMHNFITQREKDMYNFGSRILVTPDDCILDIDELADGSDPRSRFKLYIETGPNGLNEVQEAVYFPGNRVPSHEHVNSGVFETFLIEKGAVEILQLSKKARVNKGDMLHIMPFMPHSIHCLEDGTIFRAFHQGLWLTQFTSMDRAFKDRHPEIHQSPEFKKVNAAHDKSSWFDYILPECRDVSQSEIPSIRPYDFGLAEYSYEGIILKLKVGRWETGGLKEVWQLRLSKGYKISWEVLQPFILLYEVFNGSVRVNIEGMEPFTAKTRDVLNIPKYLSGSIEALEDTVLLDAGCQGYLTRFMDELNIYKVKEPAKLKDKSFVKALMEKNDYHVLFESL